MEETRPVHRLPVLTLPMPDGSFQRFAVEYSPIMEKPLADRYPQIRTYVGWGIDDPTAMVRFDHTPHGFHAMVYAPGGSVYIDPYARWNTDYYIVYRKSDFVAKGKTFDCRFDEQMQGMTGDPAFAPKQHDGHKHPDNGFLKNMPPITQFGDCQRRHYRLAISATGEYSNFHGGNAVNNNKAVVLAAQVTSMNRVNGIFEQDCGIRMNLVANNDQIIFLDPAGDPFTNGNPSLMINENPTAVNAAIGSSNYDIGHVFGTNSGGLAQLNGPCGAGKARGVTGSAAPVGDPFDIDYVAHEMGHQWGANHTQNNNCNRVAAAAFETGSAITIMGYAGICSPNVANNSIDHFHVHSLQEMANFIVGTGSTCDQIIASSNQDPIIDVSSPNFTIPKNTPFVLTANASDPDGNPLTYCWEQYDNDVSTQPPVATSVDGPNFRCFSPVASPSRYFPNLTDLAANTVSTWEVLPNVGRTMTFRCTVRDNAPGSGCTAVDQTTLTVSGTAGPFVVTAPSATGITWPALSSQTVTWNVAGTSAAPVSCANVDILLSLDGGLTYPITLATAVPNNGSRAVTAPNNPTNTARVMVKGNGNVFFDISNNNFAITAPLCNLTATATAISTTCGQANGAATAQPVGGGSPFSFAWSNGQTAATANALAAGTYTVTITDDASCTATASVSVGGSLPAAPVQINGSLVFCLGQSTVLSATGGTSYVWSDGTSGSTVTVTTAGTIGVTATNAQGCTATASAVTSNHTEMFLSLVPLDVTCFGLSNGSITADASGGSAPYSYSWADGSTDAAQLGIPAGTYSVTATDQLGCTISASDSVLDGPLVQAVAQNNGPSCPGADIQLNAGGGDNYDWSGPNGFSAIDPEPVISNATLADAGTYTVTVTDASGCSATASTLVEIGTENLSVTITAVDVSCLNACDGQLTASAANGAPGYTYAWSDGSGSETLTDLCAEDVLTVSVTDANGCSGTATATVVIATDSEAPSIACPGPQSVSDSFSVVMPDFAVLASATDNCSASISQLSPPIGTLYLSSVVETVVLEAVDPSGNTSTCSFEVNVQVLNNCNFFATVSPSTISVQCGSTTSLTASPGASYQWSNGETGSEIQAASGTYTVTVDDGFGCTASAEAIVSELPDTVAPVIVCPVVQVLGDSFSVVLPDYSGLALAFDDCGLDTIFQLSPAPGTIYTSSALVTVVLVAADPTGNLSQCTFVVPVTVLQPCTFTASVTPNTVTVPCAGDATLNASAGTSYAWSNGATTAQIQVGIGSYSVTVTNFDGCTASASATVNPSLPPLLGSVETSPGCPNGSDGSSTLLPSGGTPPYFFLWSTGATTATLDQLSTGFYSATVSDANGCSASAQVVVPFGDDLQPPVFSNCPVDDTVSLAFGAFVMPDYAGLVVASDNCGNPSLVQLSPAPGTQYNTPQSVTVVLEATDDASLTTTCSFVLTFESAPPATVCVPDSAARIWYVDEAATGSNNGNTWGDAFTDLQSALAAAANGDNILVAAGTYYPTTGTDRNLSFNLKPGVDLYGGFPSGGAPTPTRASTPQCSPAISAPRA